MIFHENCLPADHEITCLICCFWKSSTIQNCRLLQIIGGTLWVKEMFMTQHEASASGPSGHWVDFQSNQWNNFTLTHKAPTIICSKMSNCWKSHAAAHMVLLISRWKDWMMKKDGYHGSRLKKNLTICVNLLVSRRGRKKSLKAGNKKWTTT